MVRGCSEGAPPATIGRMTDHWQRRVTTAPCTRWQRMGTATACMTDDEASVWQQCPLYHMQPGLTLVSSVRPAVYHCIDGGSARTMLVGPLVNEVQTWTTMVVPVALLRRGDRILSYTGDAVYAPSTEAALDPLWVPVPVPYPPLHMHHIHVSRNDGDSSDDGPHWFETHGDCTQCIPRIATLASP